MKTIIFLLLTIIANASLGQSRSLLNKIAMDVAVHLEDGRLRGKTEYVHFFKDSNDLFIEGTRFDRTHRQKLKNIFVQYADSLVQDKRYHASIYFDEYSNQLYPVVYKQTEFKGFPNFDDYQVYPRIQKGMINFVKLVYEDLRRHKSIIDTLSWTEWSKPIDFLIGPRGEHSLINDRVLTGLLDSSLTIDWQPGFYNGRLVKSLVSISMNRHLALSNNEIGNYVDYVHAMNVVSIDHVLMEKYKGKLVQYKSDQPKPNSKLLVSFVFNPNSERLENPIIHYGDIREAEGFIAWLEKLKWPTNVFYWAHVPIAKRTYFYRVMWKVGYSQIICLQNSILHGNPLNQTKASNCFRARN